MTEAKTEPRRVVRRRYGVTKTRRPYLLEVDEGGRNRITILPMPELDEIIEQLTDETLQRLFVQTYAKGLNVGYRQGLDERDEALAELAESGVSLALLRKAVGFWSPAHMRKVLFRQGLTTRRLGELREMKRSRRYGLW